MIVIILSAPIFSTDLFFASNDFQNASNDFQNASNDFQLILNTDF